MTWNLFFADSAEAAYNAAMRDQDQFLVRSFLGYTGDSRARTKMSFRVAFEDGDIVVLPWSKDLECEAFYKFCESRPHLYHLTLDSVLAKRYQTQLRKEEITCVALNDSVYIDLRFFGDLWYEALALPDFETSQYVFKFTYTHWYHKQSRRKISGHMDLDPTQKYSLDGYAVFCWGSVLTFDAATMVLVTEALVRQYPQIMA
jgi:hypothetical protein